MTDALLEFEWREQFVNPVQRVPQRPMTFRRVARTTRDELQATVQPRNHRNR